MGWVLDWRGSMTHSLLSLLRHLSLYITVTVPAEGRIYREAKTTENSGPSLARTRGAGRNISKLSVIKNKFR